MTAATAVARAATRARAGYTITHRRYVPFGDAHYRGDLLSGGYVLSLFSDVATDLCDVLEVQARVARVGRRSRTIEFEARVLARSDPGRNETAGRVLDRPLIVVSATGTIVVPERAPAGGSGGQ
jgi:3-aminobutyryl-CoA ammonia-lyase